MALHYLEVYRKQGVTRSEHFLKPRIIKGDEFEFPLSSMVFWTNTSSVIQYISKDNGYFKKVGKNLVEVILEYPEDVLTTGNFTKAPAMSPLDIIKQHEKAEKRFKFLKPKQSVSVTPQTTLILSYGALSSRYVYKDQTMRDYHIYYNNLASLVNDTGRVPNIPKFIITSIPSKLPSAKDLDKAATNMNNSLMRIFRTDADLNVLHLWMLLDQTTKHRSVFSFIPDAERDNVNFLLVLDNKVVMLSYKALLAFVEGYNVKLDDIEPRKTPDAKKMFYKMLDYITKNTYSKPEEFELDETPKIFGGGMLSPIGGANMQFTAKDVGYKKMTEDDVKKELDEIDKEWSNDWDAEEEDDVDELEKLAEAKNDQDNRMVILETLKESLNEDDEDDGIEAIDDSLEATMDHMAKLYKDINSMMYEEAKYTNAVEQAKLLKESKVIKKSDVDKLQKVLKEQPKKKMAYCNNARLEDILDDNQDQIGLSESEVAITGSNTVFDNSYNKNIVVALDKKYISKQYKKDIMRMVYALQNYTNVIEDYKVEEEGTILGIIEEHIITVRPLSGRSTTLRFKIPKVSEDGTFKYRGNVYRMRKMRQDLPIRKISNTEVIMSSYYGKIAMKKASHKWVDAGHWVMNALVHRYEDGRIKNLVMLQPKNADAKLPYDYGIFGRYVKSFIHQDIMYFFNYQERYKLLPNITTPDLMKIEGDKYVICGVHKKVNPVLMDKDGVIYIKEGPSLKKVSNLYTILDIDRGTQPIEFTSINILKTQIPVAIVLAYYVGITQLFQLLQVQYEKIPNNKRVETNEKQYIIQFKDVKLVVTRDFGLIDMIISGFLWFSKTLKNIPMSSLENKSDFAVLFNHIGISDSVVIDLKLLESMFVDPATMSMLKNMKEPTNFKGLLIKASEMLLDDNYISSNNIVGMAIKGYERIPGLIYNELTKAIKAHETRSRNARSKLTINPNIILNRIQEDSTTVIVDDLNPITMTKQRDDVSYIGAGGRSKETMSGATRVMHETEIGVISESTKDSTDVGITAYLTANPKITSIRGNVGEFDDQDGDWASAVSSTALLSPFGLNDDSKRLNFASIFIGHVIPINKMQPPYVRTGYESIIPIKVDNKYCVTAEDDGKVVDVTKTSITVEYKKMGKKSYVIRDWTTKEESSACYTHHMTTFLKKGDKFIKDDTLVYDSSFFEQDMFNPRRVIMKQGDIINVALMEDDQTNDDSGAISKKVCDRLGTTVTKVIDRVVDVKSNIMDMVKIGTKVDPSTALYTFVDAVIDTSKFDKATIALLKNIQSKAVKAKVKGVVTNIKVLYNCDLKEMSKSLREVAEESDVRLKREEGYPGYVNSAYSVEGRPLQPGTAHIKVYVDVQTSMSLGDKGIFGNQLKFTVGEVYEYDADAQDGTPIDAVFSYKAIAARIVNSAMLVGTTSMLLEKLGKNAVDMYFK